MFQEESFNIAIISIYSFPFGGAPTNRILAYSKGLLEANIDVDIIIPVPTDNLPVTRILPDEGQCNKINYYYSSGRYRSKYKILRGLSIITRFRKIYGYFSSSLKIWSLSKSKKYSCLIISADEIVPLYIYSTLAKIIGTKSVFIFDEYPIPIRHKLKSSIPKWKSFLYKIVLQKLDAYVSISDELKAYFCGFSNKPTHVMPVIVDTSRFDKSFNITSEPKTEKYLCYMGNMELSKDDIDNIIRAFALIANNYKDIDLFLYGNPDVATKSTLLNLISSLNLETRVYLKGRASNDSVPSILSSAYILVSSQPDTLRAKGGFPTKLGEYLASGIPSLLTDVGENAKYVKDGEHVFFAKPQDPIKYADKLKMIIENYQDALRIGQNGKKFILDNYSHINQGRSLSVFLKSLFVKY
jgi:glycosyltransferase involved in cell wall biosynthesis